MNIKRYFAPNIRQAINKVRAEQGPDAVILSNQRINGGVEIVAAVDFDETMLKKNLSENTGDEKYVRDSLDAHHQPIQKDKNTYLQENYWSQDPTLVEMRGELKSLRFMLENQLSGLAWGDMARRNPKRAELIQRLMKMGLSSSLCREISDELSGTLDIENLWHQAMGNLAQRIISPQYEILDQGGVVALVGPTGVGKTTTAAKIAARYALRHGNRHVALVTIDNYRVGAHEQLRTYGRILDVPVKVASSREELGKVLEDLLDRSLVIIDTAGMSQHDEKLLQQKTILESNTLDTCDLPGVIRKILLLSTTTRLSGMEDVVQAFSVFEPDGCVLTKLDESTSLGGAISATTRHNLPITYVCDGQRVPEDIHVARPHTLVNQCLEIMERAESVIDEDMAQMNYGKEVANAYF